MARPMKARYPGKCFRCSGAIVKGDAIMFAGAPYVWHEECHALDQAEQKAEDDAREASQREHLRAMKAGELVRVDANDREVVVRHAPSYAVAKEAAMAWICGIRMAVGSPEPRLLSKMGRDGKRYLGREMVSGGGYAGGLRYHEGWAFPYRLAVPS